MFKMTGLLMKSLRRKPVTLMYPETAAKSFENTRGSIEINLAKCTMCGACVEICPASAIETDEASGRWMIQRMQCVLCGQCVDICPEKCLSAAADYVAPEEEKILDIYDPEDEEKNTSEMQ